MKNKVKNKWIFYAARKVNQEGDCYHVQDDMEVTIYYRFTSDLSRRLIFQVSVLEEKNEIIYRYAETNNVDGTVGKPMLKINDATNVAITTPRIASHLIATNTLRRTSSAASSGV